MSTNFVIEHRNREQIAWLKNEKPSRDTGQNVNKIPWRIHPVCFMSETSITGQAESSHHNGTLAWPYTIN